jgi:hypothetical protein
MARWFCPVTWLIYSVTQSEIIVLIQRPDEHFSELLGRWRQTQVLLDCDYEWNRPHFYRQIMTEGGDRLYPLFVLYPDSDERIVRGLTGAHLPFVIANLSVVNGVMSECAETAEELT